MTAAILNSVLYFEVAALLVALYYLLFAEKEITVLFPIYLFCVVFIEFLGLIFMYKEISNVFLYNILGGIEFSIFTYIFYSKITNKKYRLIIGGLLIFSLLIFTTELLLVNDPTKSFMNLSFGVASIMIVMMCCLYIHNIAQTPDVVNLSLIPLMWICFGLLFYHLCALPITALANNINKIDMDDKLLVIQAIPSIIMYTSFILAYIWTHQKSNT